MSRMSQTPKLCGLVLDCAQHWERLPPPESVSLSSACHQVQMTLTIPGGDMRLTKLMLICVFCLMVAPAVWGQATSSTARPGILGYLDPHTGAFRPVPAVDEAAIEPPATATFGGTI